MSFIVNCNQPYWSMGIVIALQYAIAYVTLLSCLALCLSLWDCILQSERPTYICPAFIKTTVLCLMDASTTIANYIDI